jgi:hypothetical protein
LVSFVRVLKIVAFDGLFRGARRSAVAAPLRLLSQLYSRQVRSPFCDTTVWELDQTTQRGRDFYTAWQQWVKTGATGGGGAAQSVLTQMPYVLPFEERARALRKVVGLAGGSLQRHFSFLP